MLDTIPARDYKHNPGKQYVQILSCARVRILVIGGDVQLCSLLDWEILISGSGSGANLRSFLDRSSVLFRKDRKVVARGQFVRCRGQWQADGPPGPFLLLWSWR